MRKNNHKKIIVTSALVAGLATTGGLAVLSNQSVSATSNNQSPNTSEMGERPELSDEQKAELDEKLSGMTKEEKKEWLESHKPEGSNPPELGELPNDGERPGKPADLTDEEWEKKVEELKAKLDAMTDEERKEWLESHKPEGSNPPELGELPNDGERPELGELPNDGELPEKPTNTNSNS